MALFGRNSSQQSAMADVPPELRPYYERPTLGARLRRAALFVLPLLVVLILVAGAVWGLVWLNRHKPAASSKTSNGQTSQQSAQNNQPSSGGSSQQGSQNQNSNNPSSSQQNQPTNQNQPSPQSTGGTQPTTGTSGTAPSTGSSPQGSIPNTGPGDSILTVSIVAGAAGAAAFHVRQVRRAKQNG